MSAAAASTISVRVPFRLRKQGGRKRVVSPDGASRTPRPQIDNALVKALARAHRWKRLLETGQYANLTDLAKAEKINRSYVSRVLRLTLLAPNIVEAILEGRQAPQLTMARLMQPFPAEWETQNFLLGLTIPKPTISLNHRLYPAQ